jgi:hypothetical protein
MRYVAVFLALLLANLAVAQVPTSGNVFVGYSYLNTSVPGANRISTNGWGASFEGKIVPFLGMVADFDGHYKSQSVPVPVPVCPEVCLPLPGLCPPSGCPFSGDFTQYNFLFGPRVSVQEGRFRWFSEFLVGVAHMNDNGVGNNSFARAIGGGLDYRIMRPVAWRFQCDYLHTSLPGGTQNSARLSTGLVLRF